MHPYSNTTRETWQGQALRDGESVICDTCDGEGTIIYDLDGWWKASSYTCDDCGGSGLVAA